MSNSRYAAGAAGLQQLIADGYYKEPNFPVLFNNGIPVARQSVYDDIVNNGGVIVNKRGPANIVFSKEEMFKKIEEFQDVENRYSTFEQFEQNDTFNLSAYLEKYDDKLVFHRGPNGLSAIHSGAQALDVYSKELQTRSQYGYGVLFEQENYSQAVRQHVTYSPMLAKEPIIRLKTGISVERGYIDVDVTVTGKLKKKIMYTAKLVIAKLQLDYATVTFIIDKQEIIVDDVHTNLIASTEQALLNIAHAKKYRK